MSALTMTRHLATAFTAMALIASVGATSAQAQSKPRPRTVSAPPSPGIEIGGYGMLGHVNFTAAESFDAILVEPAGPIFGGGARVGLPWGGLFVDIGAWRFQGEGERVFVFGSEVIPMGIPVEVKVTPIELSAGWRFRFRRS